MVFGWLLIIGIVNYTAFPTPYRSLYNMG